MDVKATYVIDYFRTSSIQYTIPLFQRRYVWSKEKWKTLWNDIVSYYQTDMSQGNQSPHFMGTIVSIPTKRRPIGDSQFLIIDGQQRLITISILLCAIRDTVAPERKVKIQELLCNNEKGLDYLKILPTQIDREPYRKLIEGNLSDIKDNTHNLYECYRFFKKHLTLKESGIVEWDPNIIFNIIHNQLQVVMINLADTDDPYLIFESLNYKGEKLTQTDLIRNLVLMKFQNSPGTDGEQERIYNSFWLYIEKLLDKQLEHFFFDYIRLHNKIKGSKNHIYGDMQKILNGSTDIQITLKHIKKCAMYYDTVLNPEKETNLKIRAELMFLNRTQSQVFYPLLLKMFLCRENGLGDNVFYHCLQILNSLIIRRAICLLPTNTLNNLVTNLLGLFPKKLEQLDIWLQEELLNRINLWPNNEVFRQAIVSNPLSDKNKQILFLESIEKHLASKEVINLSEGISLEHIMPQTLTREWRHSLGENSAEIHNRYLSNLGNLTLTGYNSELSNKTFEEKKNMLKGYCNSGIRMNLEIAKNNKWGKDEIIARAKHLADIAIKIWKYPERKKTNNKTLTLNDSWTRQKVHTLLIKDAPYPVSSWRKVAFKIIEYIREEYYHNNVNKFPEAVKNNKLSSIDANFNVSGLNDSANEIKRKIKTWLRQLNIDESLFKFEIE